MKRRVFPQLSWFGNTLFLLYLIKESLSCVTCRLELMKISEGMPSWVYRRRRPVHGGKLPGEDLPAAACLRAARNHCQQQEEVILWLGYRGPAPERCRRPV